MKKILVTVCFLFAAYVSIGQQQTAYEKKVYTLRVQLLRKLGVSQTLLNQKSKLSDLEGLFLMGDILRKLNTEEGILLLLQFNREIKDAEKLKTSVDFQRDKEKKEKEQREAKLKEIENQKKQAILEKERLEKEKIEKYNNSDLVKVKSDVFEKFQTWYKKDEFEKSEQYESRIKESANENFEKINAQAIQNRIDDHYQNQVKFTLGSYNADKEYFSIELEFKELKWNDIVKVPLGKAPEFKDDFNFEDADITFTGWGIYNNNLYPNRIVVKQEKDEKAFQFVLPISNLEDYKVSLNSLGLQTNNSNNIEFSFFNYQQKIQQEKEKLEIQKKEREEQLLKEEEERKKREAEELEKKQIQIAKEKQEQELLRKKEREIREFEASDFGQLRRAIKTEFSAWLEKKEFENQQQFEDRVKKTTQQEFKKIVDAKIADSKYGYLNSKFFAKLGEYNSTLETFKIEFDRSSSYLKSNGMNSNYNTIFGSDISINIPQTLAPSLKREFSSSYSNTILVYVLDMQLVNNKWHPTKIVFVFPNDNSTGVDAYSRNDLHVEEKDNDKYVLAFARNYSYKPVKLKNINSQFKDNNLDKGIFYYLWQTQNPQATTLDFTIENLDIKLPF